MTTDRREHPRLTVEMEVRVAVADTEYRAVTRDLSRSGLCFLLNEPVDLGAHVVVEMALKFSATAFSEALQLAARVVWCTHLPDGYQVGCAFSNLTPQSAQYLDLFLKYLKGEVDIEPPAAAATDADDGASHPDDSHGVDDDDADTIP